MKKALLVTLADKNYLKFAKQVFAGAYFNAGWKGDYMLLAHDIPEKDLVRFRKKGILIKHCRPLYDRPVADTTPAIISKLYLFTPEFKKWSHVIYVDVDVIIRSSLDALINTQGFASVCDMAKSHLGNETVNKSKYLKRGFQKGYEKLLGELKRKYNLRSIAFGAGFFVFNTSLIENNTFEKIKAIIDRYRKIAANADQFALNLYFYGQWKNLPAVYDFYLYKGRNQWGIPNNRIKAIIIHFSVFRSWAKKNHFYQEWKDNYRKFEAIDLKDIPKGNSWSPFKIRMYDFYLSIREKIYPLKNLRYKIWYGSINLYFSIVTSCEKKFPHSFRILKMTKAFIKNLGQINTELVFYHSYEEELKPYFRYFKGQILNAGSGERDIQSFIKGKVYNLDISTNLRANNVEIHSSIQKIPIRDNFFNAVICNAVLNYVENPPKAISEMSRVLKKNGYLYLCTPFMQSEHNDRGDFWRFTRQGLSNLLSQNGFKIIKIEGCHTFAQTIGWFVVEWSKTKKTFVYYPLRLIVKLCLYLFVRYSSLYIDNSASAYRVLAQKK